MYVCILLVVMHTTTVQHSSIPARRSNATVQRSALPLVPPHPPRPRPQALLHTAATESCPRRKGESRTQGTGTPQVCLCVCVCMLGYQCKLCMYVCVCVCMYVFSHIADCYPPAEGGDNNTDMGNRDPAGIRQVVIPSLPPLNKLP